MPRIIPINHEAIARYRQIRENNKRYSIQDECSHCEFFNKSIGDEIGSFSTHTTRSSMMDWSASPPMSPRSPMRPRTSKYHGEHNMRSPMEKSPASVDRSLRNQGWVGGHTPNGFKKPKRSWKLKNPADEIYLTQL